MSKAGFKSRSKAGHAAASKPGAVNQTPQHYIIESSENTGQVTICLVVDSSGSMQIGGFDQKVGYNVQNFYRNHPHTNAILYGSTNCRPRQVTDVVRGQLMTNNIPNQSVVSSWGQFNTQFRATGPTYCHKLQFITPANIYVLIGDGALSDPVNWKRHLQEHARKGTFKNTTHMVFVFAPHTNETDKYSLTEDIRPMLQTAGIACEVIVHDNLANNNYLNEIISPIESSYKVFPNLPENYLPVSTIVAFHKDMMPNVLGNYLKEHNTLILGKLLAAVLTMANNDPQSLVDDPVWAKVHKALIVAFADKPKQYTEKMSELKRSLPKDHPHRKALDTLYKNSYKDDAKIRKVLSEIDPSMIIGYLVTDESDNITEDYIIEAIRTKRTMMVIKEMRNHMRFRRRENGEPIDPSNLPGMPILDMRRASPKECRTMFQLLFIQWTQASLDQTLQWISAMCLLTSSGRAVDPEIVSMVEKSFFDAEKHTIKMLGITEDGIDPEKKELLFHVPITKMLAEVLTRHKKKMFPITLGGRDGESIVPRRVLMEQINTWKMVSRIHTFIRVIHDSVRPKITRKATKIITQGTGSVANNLAPGDVVEFLQDRPNAEKRTRWKRRCEPWVNLPTIGVVIECKYHYYQNRPYEVIIQQLDDIEWNGLFYENNDTALADSLTFNVESITGLNLMVLASIPLDQNMMKMSGAVEPHRELVHKINRMLMGLKADGGNYHRDAPIVRGLRNQILDDIKEMCGSAKSVTHEIEIDVDVPLEVIYHSLPVTSGMWNLIKSGANPNMNQIMEFIGNHIHGLEDRLPNGFTYKFEGVKHHTDLSDEECEKFMTYYDQKFRDRNSFGDGLEALNVVECAICYDEDNFRKMVRHPCSHFQCHDCMEGMIKTYIPSGEETVIENMNCLCPECRHPINHPDGRINDLYEEYPEGIPNGKLFRFCTDCEDTFEQDMPCGQGIEFSEVKCIECRPPPLPSHPCPGCGISTNKESGCDHITCVCGTHWCYRCGEKFPSGAATYSHMLSGECPGGRGYGGEYDNPSDDDSDDDNYDAYGY